MNKIILAIALLLAVLMGSPLQAAPQKGQTWVCDTQVKCTQLTLENNGWTKRKARGLPADREVAIATARGRKMVLMPKGSNPWALIGQYGELNSSEPAKAAAPETPAAATPGQPQQADQATVAIEPQHEDRPAEIVLLPATDTAKLFALQAQVAELAGKNEELLAKNQDLRNSNDALQSRILAKENEINELRRSQSKPEKKQAAVPVPPKWGSEILLNVIALGVFFLALTVIYLVWSLLTAKYRRPPRGPTKKRRSRRSASGVGDDQSSGFGIGSDLRFSFDPNSLQKPTPNGVCFNMRVTKIAGPTAATNKGVYYGIPPWTPQDDETAVSVPIATLGRDGYVHPRTTELDARIYSALNNDLGDLSIRLCNWLAKNKIIVNPDRVTFLKEPPKFRPNEPPRETFPQPIELQAA